MFTVSPLHKESSLVLPTAGQIIKERQPIPSLRKGIGSPSQHLTMRRISKTCLTTCLLFPTVPIAKKLMTKTTHLTTNGAIATTIHNMHIEKTTKSRHGVRDVPLNTDDLGRNEEVTLMTRAHITLDPRTLRAIKRILHQHCSLYFRPWTANQTTWKHWPI